MFMYRLASLFANVFYQLSMFVLQVFSWTWYHSCIISGSRRIVIIFHNHHSFQLHQMVQSLNAGKSSCWHLKLLRWLGMDYNPTYRHDLFCNSTLQQATDPSGQVPAPMHSMMLAGIIGCFFCFNSVPLHSTNFQFDTYLEDTESRAFKLPLLASLITVPFSCQPYISIVAVVWVCCSWSLYLSLLLIYHTYVEPVGSTWLAAFCSALQQQTLFWVYHVFAINEALYVSTKK